MIGNKVAEWDKKTFDKVEYSIRDFHGNQKLVISWLSAAVIAIGGALTANSLFGWIEVIDTAAFFIGVFLIAVGILIFFVYWGRIDLKFSIHWFSPSGTLWLFNNSFQPPINKAQLNTRANAKFLMLHKHLTEYAFLICLAEIRDSLSKHKLSYLKIKDLRLVQQKFPFFLISVGFRNIRAMLPRASDRAQAELLEVVAALSMAQIAFGVRAFDYDSRSWTTRGIQFLNEISSWDMDGLEKDLTRKICS